jgi:hypothetical protein
MDSLTQGKLVNFDAFLFFFRQLTFLTQAWIMHAGKKVAEGQSRERM